MDSGDALRDEVSGSGTFSYALSLAGLEPRCLALRIRPLMWEFSALDADVAAPHPLRSSPCVDTLFRMSRFRLGHIPLVVAAIGRGLVGTTAGRKLLAVGVGAAAVGLMVITSGSGTGGSDAARRRDGTWSGLHNEYAPRNGDFVIDGALGKAATCRVRGQAGWVSGDGWVFRGALSMGEVACEPRIAKDGRVSGRLKLKEQWNGRVKGIGGDWEERRGTALCEGDVEGTLSAGGTWKGTCETDDARTYASSFAWTLRAD